MYKKAWKGWSFWVERKEEKKRVNEMEGRSRGKNEMRWEKKDKKERKEERKIDMLSGGMGKGGREEKRK